MKIPMRSLLILLLTPSVFSCQDIDYRKGMVHFDQAFLPVMLYVYEGNLVQAKKAVFNLNFQWRRLQNQHQGAIHSDTEWAERFRRIDGWLDDAYYAIDGNRPLTAINQLEHVKYELIALRRKYNIDYYLDYLYDFQSAADMLAETANDEMLCLLEWEEFTALGQHTEKQWRRVLIQPFDAELYEFDDEQVQLLRQRQAEVTRRLAHLSKVMECADREQIARASIALEPALMNVIRLFGDDPTEQTFFAGR